MICITGSSKRSELAGVGSAIGVGFVIIWAWLILQGIAKSSEFAGVGSAVEVGFAYRGLVCITRDCEKFLMTGVDSGVEVGFDYRGLACITGYF